MESGKESQQMTAEAPVKDSTGKILIIVTNAGEYEKVGFRTGL
jgi:hypothetical protein